MMKTLLVTLLLAGLVMSGFALKCNNCRSSGTSGIGSTCRPTTETCGYNKNACVSAFFTIRPYNRFKRCIAMSDCELLKITPNVQAHCCQTDLCN